MQKSMQTSEEHTNFRNFRQPSFFSDSSIFRNNLVHAVFYFIVFLLLKEKHGFSTKSIKYSDSDFKCSMLTLTQVDMASNNNNTLETQNMSLIFPVATQSMINENTNTINDYILLSVDQSTVPNVLDNKIIISNKLIISMAKDFFSDLSHRQCLLL